MGRNTIPDRWLDYSNYGQIIEGTRILALKVPLKQALLNKVSKNEWFSPEMAATEIHKLEFVVDLTFTTRYYNPEEFRQHGIGHKKVATEGHVIPAPIVISKFFAVMDSYLEDKQRNGYIGVHCTHGVNRTGYLICRYLIVKMGFTPQAAIAAFNKARGHDMERKNYLEDLQSAGWPENPPVPVEEEEPEKQPLEEEERLRRKRSRRDMDGPDDVARKRRHGSNQGEEQNYIRYEDIGSGFNDRNAPWWYQRHDWGHPDGHFNRNGPLPFAWGPRPHWQCPPTGDWRGLPPLRFFGDGYCGRPWQRHPSRWVAPYLHPPPSRCVGRREHVPPSYPEVGGKRQQWEEHRRSSFPRREQEGPATGRDVNSETDGSEGYITAHSRGTDDHSRYRSPVRSRSPLLRTGRGYTLVHTVPLPSEKDDAGNSAREQDVDVEVIHNSSERPKESAEASSFQTSDDRLQDAKRPDSHPVIGIDSGMSSSNQMPSPAFPKYPARDRRIRRREASSSVESERDNVSSPTHPSKERPSPHLLFDSDNVMSSPMPSSRTHVGRKCDGPVNLGSTTESPSWLNLVHVDSEDDIGAIRSAPVVIELSSEEDISNEVQLVAGDVGSSHR